MPNTYENTFSNIYTRGFMTPTYLSSLIMMAVLPAKLSVNKRDHLSNHSVDITPRIRPLMRRNTYTSFFVNGIETFERLTLNANPAYQINFCGNAQDAENTASWRSFSTLTKNMIYWNYPNVGASAGQAQSVDELIDAGYQQVKLACLMRSIFPLIK